MLNLFITQCSQTRCAYLYLEGRFFNIRSSDILGGGPILLGRSGEVGGENTVLCSRKLYLLALCSANQLSGVGICPKV
jgi:hypothetical protein